MNKLLEIKNLKVELKVGKSKIYPVDDISFSLEKGDIMGIVGESGCGKTMAALSIIKLLPKNIGHIVGGQVILEGNNISDYNESEMRKIRGKKVGMIFQDPMTSLNPTLNISTQICEVLITHKKIKKAEAEEKSRELLKILELPSAERILKSYPYQLSGGMRQRVMIAIAISCSPVLLIGDEPTTALDVTIEKQILNLLKKLHKDLDNPMILISHDLNVIGELCNKVSIMYAGKIVEKTSIEEIFKVPMHPYTDSLFKCIPKVSDEPKQKLFNISGSPPEFSEMPAGCRFHPRCKYAQKKCSEEEPLLTEKKNNHEAACFYPLNFI